MTTDDSDTMSATKSIPSSTFTGEMQGGSVSKLGAISGIIKEVKKTVRRMFVAPPPRERTGAIRQ
jgi:hypothetical protein